MTLQDCFVMACIKTRHPDDLQRAIHRVRERHHFRDEFKFGRIKATNYEVFSDLVDTLERSDAHIAATVIDVRIYDPFRGRKPWQAHADIISRLVIGNLNRGEIAVVHADTIGTPEGISIGATVKRKINDHFRVISCVHAVTLDSKANQLLQAADLAAGAIFHERLARTTKSPEKNKIAGRLAVAFGDGGLTDQHSKRLRIATLCPPTRPRSRG